MWKIEHAEVSGGYGDMQDRVATFRFANYSIIIVCDGHGHGSRTVNYCISHTSLFLANLKKGMVEDQLTKMTKNLTDATKDIEDGATMSLVVLWDDGVVDGFVIGDSPILAKSAGEMFFGPNHNVNYNLKEREKAIERGAEYLHPYIYTKGYGIQMTRTFGDKKLRAILSHKPDFFRLELEQGDWVAVMTDGVLDTAHSKFHEKIYEMYDVINGSVSAGTIVRHEVKYSRDDTSLVIARFL